MYDDIIGSDAAAVTRTSGRGKNCEREICMRAVDHGGVMLSLPAAHCMCSVFCDGLGGSWAGLRNHREL